MQFIKHKISLFKLTLILVLVSPIDCLAVSYTKYQCPNINRLYTTKTYDEKKIVEYYHNQTTKINIEIAESYYCLGEYYVYLGDYLKAIENYTTSIKFVDKNPIVFFSRALVRKEQGMLVEAIKDIDSAAALDGNMTIIYHERALINYKLGNYEQVLKDLKRENENLGNAGDLSLSDTSLRSDTLLKLGRYQDAINQYRITLKLLDKLSPCGNNDFCFVPKRTKTFNQMIVAYCLLGEMNKAKKTFDEAMQYNPPPEKLNCSKTME